MFRCLQDDGEMADVAAVSILSAEEKENKEELVSEERELERECLVIAERRLEWVVDVDVVESSSGI